ncbi:hypothetical protein [Kaistia adipata]|nr:hypothetical protein [Kaistia adipata]
MGSKAWRRAIQRALVWTALIALSVYLWGVIGRAFLAAGLLPVPGAL